MPFFSLSNLTWIADIGVIPPDQLHAIEYGAGRLNVTEAGTDLFMALVGGLALIPPRRWEQAKEHENQTAFTYEDPPAVTVSQQLYLAFWPRVISGLSETCDSATSTTNITIPDSAAWYTPGNRVCYIFATVDIVAGAKTCRDCPIEQSQVISINESRLAEVPLEPDRLVNEALASIPQTIDTMLRFTPEYHTPGTNHLDASDYVQRIIKRAYVASWSSLVESMGNSGGYMISSGINIGVPSTKAIVTFQRVYVWIACQALTWVAAGIFAYVQHRCKRPLAADTIMAALFLDYDDQVREEVRASGLSDVVAVSSKRHNKKLGVLKLELDPNGGHSYLTKWRPAPGLDHDKEG